MNKEKFLQDAKANYVENPTMARVYSIYCGKYFVSYNGYFGMVFDKTDNVENLFGNGVCNYAYVSNLFSDNTVFSSFPSSKILLSPYKEVEHEGTSLQVLEYMPGASYYNVYIQKEFMEYFSKDAEFYSSAHSWNNIHISGVFVVENGEIVGYIMPVNVDRRYECR